MLFCVLLHRVGQPGYEEGPQVIYMGNDILSVLYLTQKDHGPTARCVTVWYDIDGVIQPPIYVQLP